MEIFCVTGFPTVIPLGDESKYCLKKKSGFQTGSQMLHETYNLHSNLKLHPN
jgi:hypothetical protein